MLAYVFWHWKSSSLEDARYEELIRNFHASLAAAPPAGFVRSAAAAVEGARWAASGGRSYEEWYGTRGFADFDALNEGAVGPAHAAAHDAVARAAGGGTAGVYRLRRGEAGPGGVLFAHWFDKPAGMRYAELDRLLEPFTGPAAALWMRQMVLGPSPELCIRSAEPLALPDPLRPLILPLRPVWPPPRG
ncbi:MAG: hypothetical protein ABI592_05590 [Acidobacteriota bacterium]